MCRDSTYHEYLSYLRKEFLQKSGNNLLTVTDNLSQALQLAGIAEKREALKQTLIPVTSQYNEFWKHIPFE